MRNLLRGFMLAGILIALPVMAISEEPNHLNKFSKIEAVAEILQLEAEIFAGPIANLRTYHGNVHPAYRTTMLMKNSAEKIIKEASKASSGHHCDHNLKSLSRNLQEQYMDLERQWMDYDSMKGIRKAYGAVYNAIKELLSGISCPKADL